MSKLYSDKSNKELLEACFQGIREAIIGFYMRYKDLIYSAIHKWINKYASKEAGISEDIKEVFNEAIIYIMERKFARLRQARDLNHPSPLIFLLAYQKTGKYFRKKWKERARTGHTGGSCPATGSFLDELTRNERVELVGEFLEILDPEERHIIELKYECGLKQWEIAAELGLTESNVGVRISRIKDKLRAFIEEEYGGKDDI